MNWTVFWIVVAWIVSVFLGTLWLGSHASARPHCHWCGNEHLPDDCPSFYCSECGVLGPWTPCRAGCSRADEARR